MTTWTEFDEIEALTTRVARFVLQAEAVAARSEFLTCEDSWATRERLARIDDAIFAGQRLLQRLAA